MKNITVLFLFTFCVFPTGNIVAQTQEITSETENPERRSEFKHAINMCPGGIIFGFYSVNYQYLFRPNHAMVIRFDYEDVPQTYTDASIESSGKAIILNYRYHFSGEMNSIYLGVYSRYRVFTGDGTLEAVDFDFNLTEVTFGLNAGKRWVWNNGFNINFALGYGVSTSERVADPSTPAIESVLDEWENSYEFLDPFLGEFSIGYAF